MHYGKGNFIAAVIFFLVRSATAFSQQDSVVPQPAPAVLNTEENRKVTLAEPVVMDLKSSQDSLVTSPETVETISYRLYLDNAWKQLCAYGEKAIRSGADYYYLRVRLGVAYYELKHYRKAILHLEKALDFNPGDDFAMDYLYASYFYSDRYQEAKWLSKKFGSKLAERLRSKDLSAIDYLLVENGIKHSDSSTLFKNSFYVNAGLSHSVDRRVFLFHNFSYYTQREARFDVNQFQYYLRGDLPLKKGCKLSAGFHFVNVNTAIKTYMPVAITRTFQPPPTPQGPAGVVTETLAYTYQQKDSLRNYTNYVGAITLVKQMPFFDLSLGTMLAKFDTCQQYQLNAGIVLYPLKNNSLSFGTNVYLHYEKSSNFAFAPFINASLGSRVHLSASYLNNKGPNMTENTGYFVSNSVDYTTERWAVTASVKLTSGIWAYGTYGYEKKEYITGTFNYNYHIFAIGLRIIPQFK